MCNDRGLVLDGSERGGTLQLTGNNSYQGLTQVSANSLLIDGAIAGNALVNGSGKLVAADASAAIWSTGSVNGGLQVAGNYQQSANGTLNVTLNNPLRVTGNAALDGTLNRRRPPPATW